MAAAAVNSRGRGERINLTEKCIEVTLANGTSVRVRRGSKSAGVALKLLILEAVQHGCYSAKAVREYLLSKGVDLPLRSVYYYLQALVKLGALTHSYAVYTPSPQAVNVYRGLLRALMGELQTNGVGGRRRCGRRNSVIHMYYNGSGSLSPRRRVIIVVPAFPVVEGTEVGWRLWAPALIEALREVCGDKVRVDRPRRLMKYIDGRLLLHYDISANREEQERFLNGYCGDLYTVMALDVLSAVLMFERIWGAKELEKLLRLRKRVAIQLVEQPRLGAWITSGSDSRAEGAGSSGVTLQ